jgi:2-oxo-4-hydroxy-4-carboxy-5-ureidoimidazoline decarboxylase
VSVAAFNELDETAAVELLEGCCPSTGWATSVAAARPFDDVSELLEEADRRWASLPDPERLAAIEAHPPIGGLDSASAGERREQAGAAAADAQTRAALAELNRDYRERFGFVFLTDASGRSATDMLAELRLRVGNTPEQERANAEEQQRRIVARRLRRALGGLEPLVVSTHVLDTAAGAPGAGVQVSISESSDQIAWGLVETCTTDDSGRVAGVEVPRTGWVRLSFAAAEYLGSEDFFGEIVVTFAAGDRPRAHVPLLLSPYGYSTYLGA